MSHLWLKGLRCFCQKYEISSQECLQCSFLPLAGIQGLQQGQAAGDQHVHLHVAVPRSALKVLQDCTVYMPLVLLLPRPFPLSVAFMVTCPDEKYVCFNIVPAT